MNIDLLAQARRGLNVEGAWAPKALVRRDASIADVARAVVSGYCGDVLTLTFQHPAMVYGEGFDAWSPKTFDPGPVFPVSAAVFDELMQCVAAVVSQDERRWDSALMMALWLRSPARNYVGEQRDVLRGVRAENLV